MKNILLSLLLLIPTSYAAEDICCVLKSTSGDSIQTFVWIASSDVCKGTYQGKQVCAAVKDPENTYCGSDSSKQDRCGKCGGFWTGKECLTENPVEKAKKELKEEEKKKDAEKAKDAKADDKPAAEKPATVKPVAPAAPAPTAAPQDPDSDQIFNRKNKSKSEGIDQGN